MVGVSDRILQWMEVTVTVPQGHVLFGIGTYWWENWCILEKCPCSHLKFYTLNWLRLRHDDFLARCSSALRKANQVLGTEIKTNKGKDQRRQYNPKHSEVWWRQLKDCTGKLIEPNIAGDWRKVNQDLIIHKESVLSYRTNTTLKLQHIHTSN